MLREPGAGGARGRGSGPVLAGPAGGHALSWGVAYLLPTPTPTCQPARPPARPAPQIPRFAFEKFPGAQPVLTTQMKSVGEAMAIGRTFQVR